ncbi:uncharacterized protein LOC125868586 [Solanum stenotomum]|uniref:uncharacterized protein LOC125868586 n=1 Tax=Solanum stenotomum TaxID=172797 RepID=UPI0020D12EBA|nr:uncharacterized protein LOC125868586 [Solanum stenotomum]
MAKTGGGIVKRSVHKPSKNKKRKAEEVSRSSKKKKIIGEKPKSNSDSDTMDEIYNYEDSSAQATDDVESSEENTDSGDEETSRDSRDTGDEDDDPLSLPTCAREISVCIDYGAELLSIPRHAKIKKVLQKGEKFYYKVWIYEVFPHLGNYAKKSLDSPLPIPRLLRWHTAKSDNIVKGDPFKYKAIVDEDLAIVDEYFAEEVNEQEKEKMVEKDEEKRRNWKRTKKKLKRKEKIEENKEQEKEEEQIELQEEEKEHEKLEEKVDEGSDENSMDVMGIVMELNGELNGDE